MSKTKKIVLAISLVVVLACGVWASILMAGSERTYNGTDMDLVDLYENNSNYDNSDPDGAAQIMVNENLKKTESDNVVFSVVFNFRGYDTLGESFILIAAIAGCLAILRKGSANKDPGEEEHP